MSPRVVSAPSGWGQAVGFVQLGLWPSVMWCGVLGCASALYCQALGPPRTPHPAPCAPYPAPHTTRELTATSQPLLPPPPPPAPARQPPPPKPTSHKRLMARCSGFGPDGPHSWKRIYDPIIQSYSGMAVAQGGAEAPGMVLQFLIDKVSGMLGFQVSRVIPRLFSRHALPSMFRLPCPSPRFTCMLFTHSPKTPMFSPSFARSRIRPKHIFSHAPTKPNRTPAQPALSIRPFLHAPNSFVCTCVPNRTVGNGGCHLRP